MVSDILPSKGMLAVADCTSEELQLTDCTDTYTSSSTIRVGD